MRIIPLILLWDAVATAREQNNTRDSTSSQKRYDHRKGLLRIKYSARLVEYCKALQ
jgi:hypothetical protein